MGKKNKKITFDNSPAIGSLGDAFKAAGFETSNSKDVSADEPVVESATERRAARIGDFNLHKERKGRGGKTVTIIDGIALSDTDLANLAKQMKKALGCGAAVESGAIVLQGDLIERARDWLLSNNQGVV